MTSVYSSNQPPLDHIAAINGSATKPAIPSKPSYGVDSPLGLISSLPFSPLYLYATLKGKHDLWDSLLSSLPDDAFTHPTLDAGCGRGMVLLKVAQRKAALPSTTTTTTTTPSSPAYGIDIFSTADQSGNAPSATWANAAAAGLLGTTTTTTSLAAPLPSPSDDDDSRTSSNSSSGPIVLHTASFTAPLPFRDGVFGVVTSSLAVHNVGRAGRRHALREMARCCRPGGYVLVVDLAGYVGGYAECLRGELGWTDVESAWGGVGVMFGVWPCVVLRARKPE